jgi:hypothetical protein
MKWGKLLPDRPFRDQKEFLKMRKFALIAFVLTVATLAAPASAYTRKAGSMPGRYLPDL